MRCCLPALAALLLCGAASGGSFPGGNGLIAYERQLPGRNVVVVFDPALGTTRDLVLGGQPAWSPDGARLAYVRDEVVYVANADGTGAVAVGHGSWPSWSPDGTKLAVARYDEVALPGSPRGTQQLHLVDLVQRTERQLTTGTANVFLPAWSPDGSRIAYATPDGLYVLPAQGGTPTRVPTGLWRAYGGPSWSPDGAGLAFIALNGQIVVTATDGSGARQVTYTLIGSNSFVGRPAWSPDGAHIAWTQNSDLCVTDLAGNVQRLTHTRRSASALAALPDWQPSAHGVTTIVAPRGGNDDVEGCDWNPGARVELLDGGPSPADVTLAAPEEIVFVNHTTRLLTVRTTERGEGAILRPGEYFGLSTEAGRYDFVVSGYPDGEERRGTFFVSPATQVAFTPQIFRVRYGASTFLTGTAGGGAGGAVNVWARPRGTRGSVFVGSARLVDGRWRLRVAPRVTTRYEAVFGDARADRLMYVLPLLRLTHTGTSATVTVRPIPALAHLPARLFHLSRLSWTSVATAQTSLRGVAVFRRLGPGRYYVAFGGGGRYAGVVSTRFTVRG